MNIDALCFFLKQDNFFQVLCILYINNYKWENIVGTISSYFIIFFYTIRKIKYA